MSKASEILLSVKEVNGNRIQDKSFTFMVHNQKLLPLLLCVYGMYLPSFLMHRSGEEIALVYLMRPLVDSGCRIESFYKLAKELCFKTNLN